MHWPSRWLKPSLHRDAIRLGTFNLVIASAISGLLAFYVYRGGYTTIYFDLHRHGVAHLLSSTVLAFVLIDAATYYVHRLLHGKWLYSTVHQWHHRYTVTTPFVAGAMHPVEMLAYQLILVLPAFVIPIHWV